jgi:WD40 repeat protein
MGQLEGHYGLINSCLYHTRDEALLSAGTDYQIFIWDSESVQNDNEDQRMLADNDSWSD